MFEYLCEAAFTGFLCYVVLATRCRLSVQHGDRCVDHRQRQCCFDALAYGAAYVASGFAIGPITGNMISPAAVMCLLGTEVFHGHFAMSMLYFMVWEFIGALVGAGVFTVLHAELFRTIGEEDEAQPLRGKGNEPLK